MVTCTLKKHQPGFRISYDHLTTGWQPKTIKIPVGSIVNWSWNLFEISEKTASIRVQQTVSKNRIEYNQMGFRSEVNSFSFSKQFLSPGRYYYSSGWLDEEKTIAKTGEIIVDDFQEVQIVIKDSQEGAIEHYVNFNQKNNMIIATKIESRNSEKFVQKGDRIKIELTQPLAKKSEILVKFGSQLCSEWTIDGSEIYCDFQGGIDFTSKNCDLSVNIINFGNVFISDELKNDCLIYIPSLSHISNNRLGTQGGAQVRGPFLTLCKTSKNIKQDISSAILTFLYIHFLHFADPYEVFVSGKLSNLLLEKMIISIDDEVLSFSLVSTDEIQVDIPKRAPGQYNMKVSYSTVTFKEYSLKISEKFDSFLTSTAVKIDDDYQTIIMNGQFNSEILNVKIGLYSCEIKSSSSSVIKCRVENLAAGNYIPSILTTQGFVILPEEEEDFVVRIPGTIHYNFPKV